MRTRLPIVVAHFVQRSKVIKSRHSKKFYSEPYKDSMDNQTLHRTDRIRREVPTCECRRLQLHGGLDPSLGRRAKQIPINFA